MSRHIKVCAAGLVPRARDVLLPPLLTARTVRLEAGPGSSIGRGGLGGFRGFSRPDQSLLRPSIRSSDQQPAPAAKM